MKLTILFILIFILSFQVQAIDSKAEQAIVIDYSTNEIIFEKNSEDRLSPASMTKIMTIYIVFDRLLNTELSIEDTCLISPKAYKMGGSRMFLEINRRSIYNIIGSNRLSSQNKVLDPGTLHNISSKVFVKHSLIEV